MAPKPTVRVLGTGGTIASVGPHRLDYTQYGDVGRRIPIQESLDRIPEAQELAHIRSEDLYRTNSGEIGPTQWLRIAGRINEVFHTEPDVDGIVLTHGTGTLEETAYFLQLTVKSTKPVVMTGSMRPASAMGTDADLNLYNAIRIASDPNAGGRGVLTALNNQIHSARDVTKTDPHRVETFKAYDLGVLGYVDSDHQVVFYRAPIKKHTMDTPFESGGLQNLPRVDIVPIYAGGDDLLINAVRKNRSAGLVISGIGASSGGEVVKKAAAAAVKEGIAVVLASRTATGRATMTPAREKEGFIVADNLSPLKARILLMLALTVTQDRHALQEMFYEF